MNDDRTAMLAGLGALTRFFVDDGTLGDTLRRVAELARDVTPADMVGITMLVDGRAATAVFTDAEAAQIDAAQYEMDDGPCLSAFRRQQVHRIDSMTSEDRWPAFTRDAAAHGITATLSLPLAARGESLGALNLYSRTAAFDDESTGHAEVFAAQAAIVLANAQVYWDARQLGENLREAMRSRAVIDQAMGVIMADGGQSPDEAFQLLVRASQRENRKLREIAAAIVERTARRPR